MGARSASGELVKGKTVQVPRRRFCRLVRPARHRAAMMRPSAAFAGLTLLAAAALAVQPSGAGAVPRPDPDPSATQPATTPTPDPAPSPTSVVRPTAPTPDRAPPTPRVSSSTVESVPATSSARPAAAERTGVAPKPKAKTKPKPNVAASAGQAHAPRARSGKQSIRTAATSTAGAVSATRTTKDPMILGALALLTLVLSSASLLVVLDRSERQGAGA